MGWNGSEPPWWRPWAMAALAVLAFFAMMLGLTWLWLRMRGWA